MRKLLSAAAVCLAVLSPAALLAAPSASDRDAARRLADKGAELFDAGKYEEAIDHFRRANERVHAPTFLLKMAQANVKLGKLIEGRDIFQQIADEQLAPQAPESFVNARKTARRELEDLKRRIPTLQIVVTGAPPSEVNVTVDGTSLQSIDQPIAQDPGDHTVVVTGSGGASVTRSVTLHEGSAERLEISLAQKPAGDEDGTGSKGSLAPAAVAFTVGGLGIGIGAVMGALALGKAADIKATCTNNVCPKNQQAEADSAGTLADVSTISFVVGGVGLAAGTVLLFLRPGGGSEGDAKTARAPRVSVGLGSVFVSGSF